MSFVFGLSLGNVGILLADTQLNFTFRDGSTTSDGTEPLELSFDDIGRVQWQRTFRKLAPLPIGYVAAAGDGVLSRRTLDALSGLAEMSVTSARSIILETANQLREPISRNLPDAQVAYDRTTFILLIPGSTLVTLTAISATGDILNTGQEYCAFWPPELQQTEIQHLMETLHKLTVPTRLQDAYENMKVLAQLARSVRQRSSTVGDQIEMAICIADGDKAYQGHLIGTASAFASMPVEGIAAQVVERQVTPC